MPDVHDKSPVGISGTAASEVRIDAGAHSPAARPRKTPRSNDFVATQEHMLQEWHTLGTALVVLLHNGTRIRGTLQAYDGFMISLCRGAEVHLIYKQAIMTIGPAPAEPRSARR